MKYWMKYLLIVADQQGMQVSVSIFMLDVVFFSLNFGHQLVDVIGYSG
jgi:hypothetical protein